MWFGSQQRPPISLDGRRTMSRTSPTHILDEMVRQLCASQPYLSAAEAKSIIHSYRQSTYERRRERAEIALAERRRARAGNPVYRPRSDYVGGSRR